MTTLNQNTTELQAILDAVNALPEAGGAGSTEIALQEKSITPSKSSQSVQPDNGYDGLSKVTVAPIPDEYIIPSGTLDITENGDHNVREYETVTVSVASSGGGGGTDTRFKDYFEGTLTEIVDSTITKLKANAFRSASNVTIVDLPNCTSVGGSVFRECTMETLNIPKLTGTSQTYFCYNCANLEQVNAPKITTIASSAFRLCAKLTRLEFDNPTTIAATAFQDSSALVTIIIRKTGSICTLGATSAFTNTPIANGTGYIYVPASLVDSYKSASNWSNFASQIRAIEDYPEITGG